jgi:hypothetical protein
MEAAAFDVAVAPLDRVGVDGWGFAWLWDDAATGTEAALGGVADDAAAAGVAAGPGVRVAAAACGAAAMMLDDWEPLGAGKSMGRKSNDIP